MNKSSRVLAWFQIGICTESLIRVGYCIWPVIIISIVSFMLLLDYAYLREKN